MAKDRMKEGGKAKRKERSDGSSKGDNCQHQPKEGVKMTWARAMNQIVPVWTVLGIAATIYCGLYVALPELYQDWDQFWRHTVNATIWLMIVETVVNLYFLRTVTCYFRPELVSAQELTRYAEESDVGALEVTVPRDVKLPPGAAVSDRLRTFQGRRCFPIYLPQADGSRTVKMYPYMTWRPCVTCGTHRPPRAHHCPLCRRCVLKRDHHCFFSGSCVGAHNQRFFLAFVFWAMLLVTSSLLQAVFYLWYVLSAELAPWDLLLPLVLLRWLLGWTRGLNVLMMLVIYTLLCFAPLSLKFFHDQISLVASGRVSFEAENNLKITDNRPLAAKLQAIMGRRWWLSLLVPTHRWYPTQDDGIHWPHVKMADS